MFAGSFCFSVVVVKDVHKDLDSAQFHGSEN